MDYEKKYKDALIRAREVHRNEDDKRSTMEFLFPELKENEDEKIRKEIIWCLKHSGIKLDRPINPHANTTIKDAIAWLEKQGEQKSIWHNEDEEPVRGSLILLIMQSGTPIVAKIIELNHTFNHGERWAYIDDLLEMQGKPIDKVESMFNVGDTIIKKHNSDINKFGKFTITAVIDNKYWYRDKIICDIAEQDEWEICEPVRDWSEEDEDLMHNTLSNLTELKDLYGNDYGKVGKCIDWLKSLKERMKGE